MNLRVTAGWCSEFRPRFRIRSLLHANRPPALFLHRLGAYTAAAARFSSGSLITDENLGTQIMTAESIAAIAGSDIVYLSSHGQIREGKYWFRIHDGEWPVAQDLGRPGPRVVIFDTCNLVEPAGTLSKSGWLSPGRRCPALILGFSGPASDGFKSTLRGRAFAENLAQGFTFANAWISAVKETSSSGRDIPIAIAFGKTEAAAQHTLGTASLTNMPSPTTADACFWKE